MKKILFGLLGLVMTAGLLGGGAYALFSSQATLENVSFASGNATLQIWDGDSYETTWNSTINLANMYPGYTSPAYNMWLKNASTAPISLSVAMQLTNGGVNWPNGLENMVEALVANSDESANTGWISLNAWNTTPASLPGGNIAQGSESLYKLYFRMSDTADNSSADLSLPGVGFTFTGTQAL